MNSRYVDWQKEYQRDTWEYVGRDALVKTHGEYSRGNPDGVEADDGYPMMNFAYPLNNDDVSLEKIVEVCEKTNCTVIYNNEDDRYYLALTGGGMDLTQDIALAYMIADGCIEWDMLRDVYIDAPLSVSKNEYKMILTELQRQLQISISNYQSQLKRVNQNLESILDKKD